MELPETQTNKQPDRNSKFKLAPVVANIKSRNCAAFKMDKQKKHDGRRCSRVGVAFDGLVIR
jgi:hypothetical protein